MLAFLLIIHVTQTLKEDIKSTDDLQKYMPEFVFSFKSMLFPVDYVYTGSKEKKAASRVIVGSSYRKKERGKSTEDEDAASRERSERSMPTTRSRARGRSSELRLGKRETRSSKKKR